MSETLIALQPFKAGAHSFDLCDLYEEKRHRFHEDDEANDKAKRLLRQQNYVGPITREVYQRLIKRRPPGSIGKGFTEEALVAMGVLDGDEETAEEPEAFELRDGDVEYRGAVLRTRKQGNFTRISVYSAEGKLLRAREMKSVDSAKEFVDTLRQQA